MRAQSCPNCSGAPIRGVFKTGQARVVECLSCGLQYAADYPNVDEADGAIYSRGYFADALGEREQRQAVFRELVSELERLTGGAGRLLDVGAGDGALLETARDMGWEVTGSDISTAMVEHTRGDLGLDVHHGEIESIELPEGTFDAVTLNHVLEHVRNPRATLERVAALLGERGVARVEVPNLAGLSARGKTLQSRLRLKPHPWKHYDTDHHFWFFTPATLRHTVESADLRVIDMRAPARQWGRKSAAHHLLNALYRRTLWGSHLVILARRS